jgi:hypothetical protein
MIGIATSRRSIATRVLVAAAMTMTITGCEPGGRKPPPVQSVVFRGAVVGPEGTLLEGAEVEIYADDTTRGGWVRVDRTKTSFDGSYWLRTSRVGPHRLAARHEACLDAEVEIDVPLGVGSQICEFELGPAHRSVIQGMLLDAEGVPLDAAGIALLFPAVVAHEESLGVAAADGVVEYLPYTGGSELIARYFHRGVPPDGVPRAEIDARTARFRVSVPEGFEGELVLRFRDRIAAARPWSDGDGLVEFDVDLAPLRAALGRATFVTEGGASLAKLRVVRHDVDPDLARFDVATPPSPCRLRGLPPGAYTAIADFGAAGVMIRRFEVEPGAAIDVALAPAPAASARIAISDRRAGGPSPLAASDFAVATRDGIPLDVDVVLETNGDGFVAHLERAPAGSLLLFAEGCYVELELASGAAIDAALEIVDLPTTEIDVQLTRGWRWLLPTGIATRLVLRSGSGAVVADARFAAAIDAEGWLTTSVTAPAGSYELRIEVDGELLVDDEVTLVPFDGHRLVFDLAPH